MLELIDGRDQSTPVRIARPAPVRGADDPREQARAIVDRVRLEGDRAVLDLTQRFDGVRLPPDRLRVDRATIAEARSLVRPELLDALDVMAERLRRTCERQVPQEWFERGAGELTGELVRPLRRVGIYVPGRRAAYPSSVVMAAIPAQVAGVASMALASPPGPRGEIAEPVLAACGAVGIDEVYRIGGAQAIAALAYGTENVRPVDKIVGPGNVYVTMAKRYVQGWVGIDSEAGPTEMAIVADDSARPDVLAADLIAQAEHGPLGTHALVTWVPELAEQVMNAVELQVMRHERADQVENALIEGGRAVLVRDLTHALDTVNAFAPEHLELIFPGALEALPQVRNAGAVFVGADSPVSVGDYVAGTDHILPSGGSARWSSGLSARDFVKTIYVSALERSALDRLAPHVDALAEAEGLRAHGRAVEVRLHGGGAWS
ncbi:MAG: histidinol dehydrogenase [Actinomycetota bacterium]